MQTEPAKTSFLLINLHTIIFESYFPKDGKFDAHKDLKGCAKNFLVIVKQWLKLAPDQQAKYRIKFFERYAIFLEAFSTYWTKPEAEMMASFFASV